MGTSWGIGGISSNYREYRYILSSKKGVSIRYTAEKSGTVAFSLARFFPPYEVLSTTVGGEKAALYAIFVGNEMVWPIAGGSYGRDSDWYYITKDTSYAEMIHALSDLSVSVSKGQEIHFVARLPEGSKASSMFAAVPNVHYLEEK